MLIFLSIVLAVVVVAVVIFSIATADGSPVANVAWASAARAIGVALIVAIVVLVALPSVLAALR